MFSIIILHSFGRCTNGENNARKQIRLRLGYYLIIGILFALFSGAAEGVKDKINFHYDKSIFSKWNESFWNPFISWRNKYVDLDTSKGQTFRGKYLVFTTDGWHLMKFLERWCGYIGVFFLIIALRNENIFVYLPCVFGITFLARSLTFNLIWKYTDK